MEDVRAKEPYPPFAASVKDGYAVIGMYSAVRPFSSLVKTSLTLKKLTKLFFLWFSANNSSTIFILK